MVSKKSSLEKQLFFFREQLNKKAELAWQEEQTKNFITSQLGKDFVWSEKTALVYSLGKGKPIFFRAEMDALNTNSGPKHVCGHSIHMAALMGAYFYFKKNPPKHKIFFVFQPSEENYPSGAQFVSNSYLKKQNCQAGFAFHCIGSKTKTGTLFAASMASGDYFEISIKGKGTHIKNKNITKNTDTLLVAANLIQKINNKKNKDWIINIGKVSGGESANNIASLAVLSGDIRTFSESQRKEAKIFLENTIQKELQKSQNVSISLYHSYGYPVLKNDAKILKKVREFLPIEGTVQSFGTEDFSLFPKPYLFLYISTGKDISVHQDNFSVSEDLLPQLFNYWILIDQNLE